MSAPARHARESADRDRGGFWRRQLLRTLEGLEEGRLTIVEGNARWSFGSEESELAATVEVRDPRSYGDIALGGTVGAAEGYMRGDWSTNDLTALTRILVRNYSVMDRMEKGTARLLQPLLQVLHGLRRNSERGSRKNIAAHYDLGNDFFERFLDPTMMYSSAVYPRPDASLDEAAVYKLDLVCRKLDLRPGDHVLEIGTGWGGFATHAAKNYGCQVTTTTISAEQHAFAASKFAAEGLADQITLLDQDYRQLTGHYDKVVSIEMIEAVGHQYLDDYLGQISARLKPGGQALIQAILMADYNYDAARRSVDFIKRYIFPGGFLPSVAAIMQSASKASDLVMLDYHDIGLDYARTLSAWRKRFLRGLPQIRELGFADEFLRCWEYYFCYCEGGFLERLITAGQIVLRRPAHSAPPVRLS